MMSNDVPLSWYDFEVCISNLQTLPDDLDTKCLTGSLILIEYSVFEIVPAVLVRLNPSYLSIVGNSIQVLPPELFAIEGLTAPGIGDTMVHELPQNVTQFPSTLTYLYMSSTNISYFWLWIDQLLERTSRIGGYPLICAGGPAYCDELAKIANGSTASFNVHPLSQYSTNLMDPSKAAINGSVWLSVD
ncbi:hypothetical protein PHMEG_0001068 [Phytophthora megakarya]|uniref:Uncharacterized protein n=1 Tax=Phytophthora megakarya TaxID=4795 RepID=A0A225X2M8_9STRA|nr:hypothetical protein PHMEG_0001068 [Phytophthora megakarya]